MSKECLILFGRELTDTEVELDTSKNLWANQDLIDSICLVAEERRHGRSIPGTF